MGVEPRQAVHEPGVDAVERFLTFGTEDFGGCNGDEVETRGGGGLVHPLAQLPGVRERYRSRCSQVLALVASVVATGIGLAQGEEHQLGNAGVALQAKAIGVMDDEQRL